MAIKKTNKYKAKPLVVRFKGVRIKFDSKMEAAEALKLAELEHQGIISDLDLQPKFELLPQFKVKTNITKTGISQQSSMVYTPDFMYQHGLESVVVEVKGFADTAYKLRRKLFLYQMREFGIDVFIEVTVKGRNEYRLISKNKEIFHE